jgi:hypothetical protein
MTDEEMKIRLAYERLAFLHTETMAELVETQKRMNEMSKSWWRMLKFRIKVKLGLVDIYGDR